MDRFVSLITIVLPLVTDFVIPYFCVCLYGIGV